MKGSKTYFCRNIGSKIKMKKNVGSVLSGKETIVTMDMKKAEALTAFSGSVFTFKVCHQVLEPSDKSLDCYPQDWKIK